MPVTKTAKRALRGSRRKEKVNKKILSKLESVVRLAKKSKKENDVRKAFSFIDRAAKKKTIHKNKAARIKSNLSKLLIKAKSSTKVKTSKAPKSLKKRSSVSARKPTPKRKK